MPDLAAPNDDEYDEDDLDGVLDEDDLLDGQEWDGSTSDLTKSYNRQRQLQNARAPTSGGGGHAASRSNPQKPTANTLASVDDQISALARHASKIRLDVGSRNDDRDKDKDKDKADRATSEQVLDQRTRMVLLQMINRGIVSEVHGAISTGKEANVYGALVEGADGNVTHRAIKVYKTAILVFKDRERYITGEHRFRGGYDKGNSRKMVRLWAEKEYRNLRRIHAAGVPCPEPVHLKLHVMVMGFLGDRRGWAYPRLRDVTLTGDDADQQWHALYVQLLAIMRRIYQVCRLVHADLSEYNMLYHDRRLYIIDVSQSVEPDHPRSLEFLRMDIKNVGDFFRRKGVDILADRAVFDFVTAPGGATGLDELPATIERLYDSRPAAEDSEAAAAEREVDNEVFRNQYIPQTLEQVYDIEKDTGRIEEGEGDDLVYRNLLADSVVRGRGSGSKNQEQKEDSDESDNGVALDDDTDSGGEEDGGRFDDKPRPRGRKFEPKDEKKAHKQAIKEAKRDKRKEKMPKSVKKKLVATTSKKNK